MYIYIHIHLFGMCILYVYILPPNSTLFCECFSQFVRSSIIGHTQNPPFLNVNVPSDTATPVACTWDRSCGVEDPPWVSDVTSISSMSRVNGTPRGKCCSKASVFSSWRWTLERLGSSLRVALRQTSADANWPQDEGPSNC